MADQEQGYLAVKGKCADRKKKSDYEENTESTCKVLNPAFIFDSWP
jgi:hypothetical protein